MTAKPTTEARIEEIVDEEFGDEDHYLRHVTPDDYDVKIRHDGHIETDVVDGSIVHKIVESVDPDAHGDSVRFAVGTFTCPIHGRDNTESDRSVDEDAEMTRTVFTCECDGCPFEAHAAQARAEYGTPDYERPLWFRATVPHDFDGEGFTMEKWNDITEDATDEQIEDYAAVARKIHVADYTDVIRDDAYVSAEFDDDMNKTADSYLDTFECARCGGEFDAGVERTHPHFGDVCPDCEDATVWSIDDADLPDDVEARMADHKSFNASKITALLRDVIHFPNYAASVANEGNGGMFDIDKEDVDPEDVGPIKTGKQGKRNMGDGNHRAGTGLRRSKDGVFNGMAQWRTLLRDAVDTGLIRRADDGDVDDTHHAAAWEATDKGRDVFDAIARCETCGARMKPYKRVSHYNAGRRSETSKALVMACPTCDDMSHGGGGDSSSMNMARLPGVDYDA